MPEDLLARGLQALSVYVDTYPPNAVRDREALDWHRVGKVGEEFGEVMEAMVGWTNDNPRKGQTHSLDDVTTELLDVATAALGAVEHLTSNNGEALGMLRDHVRSRVRRAGIVLPDAT